MVSVVRSLHAERIRYLIYLFDTYGCSSSSSTLFLVCYCIEIDWSQARLLVLLPMRINKQMLVGPHASIYILLEAHSHQIASSH